VTSKVLLAAACGRRPASAYFFDAFYNVKLPPGSGYQRVTGAHITRNMNAIINMAIEDYDYLFYVDDDLLFDTDVVMRMLAHQKDRVSPLVCHRCPPFPPFLLDELNPDGTFHYMTLPLHTGLIRVPIGIMGAPGLTATSVLRQLTPPYFPENTATMQGDVAFTAKLHALGVESYCDLDTRFDHIGEHRVSLQFVDGGWTAQLAVIRDG
jgi:hypothetical protein